MIFEMESDSLKNLSSPARAQNFWATKSTPTKAKDTGKIVKRELFFLRYFNDPDRGFLEKEKKPDEAFNFEQMADWLQSGKRLPLTEEDVIKALGI